VLELFDSALRERLAWARASVQDSWSVPRYDAETRAQKPEEDPKEKLRAPRRAQPPEDHLAEQLGQDLVEHVAVPIRRSRRAAIGSFNTGTKDNRLEL